MGVPTTGTWCAIASSTVRGVPSVSEGWPRMCFVVEALSVGWRPLGQTWILRRSRSRARTCRRQWDRADVLDLRHDRARGGLPCDALLVTSKGVFRDGGRPACRSSLRPADRLPISSVASWVSLLLVTEHDLVNLVGNLTWPLAAIFLALILKKTLVRMGESVASSIKERATKVQVEALGQKFSLELERVKERAACTRLVRPRPNTVLRYLTKMRRSTRVLPSRCRM